MTQWDTGLYHYPSVNWLKTYGVTPGIALLYFPLGFSCSWYAFVTPFDVGWWDKRISAAGGFPIMLVWLHSCMTILRAQRNTAQVSDWFILLACGWMIAPFVHYYLSIACLATDIPTTTLVILVVWALLRDAEIPRQAAPSFSSDTTPIWLPLVLAFGAFACKLSAAPAPAGVMLWALWQTRCQPKQWRQLLGAAVLLFTPVSVARFITSGYPFFPSSLGAYPVDWAFDPQKLPYLTTYIRDFARWMPLPGTLHEGERSHSTGWFDLGWLPRWIHIDTLSPIYLGLTLVAGGVLLRRNLPSQALRWVVGVAWAGCLYILISAPTFRYGIGFFIALPVLWVAQLLIKGRTMQALWVLANSLALTVVGMTVFLHRSFLILTIIIFNVSMYVAIEMAHPVEQRLLTVVTWRQVRWIVGTLGVGFIATIMLLLTFRNDQATRLMSLLVRPALLPTASLTVKRVNDVDIYYPIEGSQGACWDAPLPCGIHIDPEIALRDPQRGLAAGFKRQPDIKRE